MLTRKLHSSENLGITGSWSEYLRRLQSDTAGSFGRQTALFPSKGAWAVSSSSLRMFSDADHSRTIARTKRNTVPLPFFQGSMNRRNDQHSSPGGRFDPGEQERTFPPPETRAGGEGRPIFRWSLSRNIQRKPRTLISGGSELFPSTKKTGPLSRHPVF